MFSLFRRRVYLTAIIPELTGEAGGVFIVFKNYPVRQSVDEKKIRKEVYTDFNVKLLEEIFQKIGNLDSFIATAQKHSLELDMDGQYRIACEIVLQNSLSPDEFRDALLDAIINAFVKENIGR